MSGAQHNTMNSSILSIKRHLSVGYRDYNLCNVLVNAVAAMLIYSSHFASCAIAPIVLESMKDEGKGIDCHLLFIGMALSSTATVISCPLISPVIDKWGTRFCLVMGGIFVTTLAPSLLYPIPAVFLTFQTVNGVGCALLRASSLKYLTDTSPREKLPEYNGLHWSIFMSSLMVGNSVLFLATGNNNYIDTNLRVRICASLTVLGGVGVLLYTFALRKEPRKWAPALDITPHYCRFDSLTSENSALMEPLTVSPSKEYLLFDAKRAAGSSSSHNTDSEYLDETSPYNPGFWDSTKTLFIMPTVNLVIAMLACAVYPLMFCTFGPMFIGTLLANKQDVALFGVCVGLGEIIGSLFAGRIVSNLGPKFSALLVGGLTIVCLGVSALVYPLSDDIPVIVAPTLALFLPLGLFTGVGDASTGVLISTIIGTVYGGESQAAFALYSLVFNLSAIPLYITSCLVSFYAVLVVMVILVTGNAVSICLIDPAYLRRGP